MSESDLTERTEHTEPAPKSESEFKPDFNTKPKPSEKVKTETKKKGTKHSAIQPLIDIYKQAGLILSIGKSRQGKSFLVRYLLSYGLSHNKLKFGMVFQGSKSMNDDYSQFLPSKCIVDGYDEEKLKAYIEKLKAHKQKLVEQGKADEMPRSFLVFDDLLGQMQKSQWIDNFFALYRHLNITVFLNVQYLRTAASSTLVREQASFFFAFTSQSSNQIKALYDAFASVAFDKYEDFKKAYLKATDQNYHALMWSCYGKGRGAFSIFKAPEKFASIKFDF